MRKILKWFNRNKFNIMQTLILDYSRWRCGGDDIYRVGDGETRLLNEKGYMCCLGQFCPQVNDSITEQDLLDVGYPSGLGISVPGLIDSFGGYCNTGLSREAIDINDDETTTPERKIELLKELFLKYDYIIEVINKI